MTVADTARLAWFFGRLAVKERIAPRLHVRPLVAELFLTDNCNLRCTSCGCWTTNTKGELSTDEWRDVLRQLVALRIHKVNFTGGEPLIRPDALALMSYAREVGVRHLHLNTNGIRLTPPVLDEVLAAGVRSFNVSVDGPTALVHDRIRGRLGAFETTTRHLRNLIAARDRLGLKVRMNFTVMRDNVDSLPGIAALAQELGVALYLNLVTDRTFLFRTDAVTDQTDVAGDRLDAALAELETMARADRRWLPRYSELRYLRGHFDDLVQRDLPCAESQLKLMVHSRGEIGGCWAHDPTASVRQRPIAEIVDAPEYRDEHARLFRKECVGCGSNYSLNLRWRPGTYLADRQWLRGRRRLV
ncbi:MULTISPECIES: radical SAM protein [Micromonospora]|uniref:radical SAM protein n=1 Tax=Micromonospora TaxID=1873 RepID=UPI001315A2E8|nr:radical SAM protein [Micromonospora sp. BL1]NED59155.1 radical SAM protein [Micromonospora aurantiaca]